MPPRVSIDVSNRLYCESNVSKDAAKEIFRGLLKQTQIDPDAFQFITWDYLVSTMLAVTSRIPLEVHTFAAFLAESNLDIPAYSRLAE